MQSRGSENHVDSSLHVVGLSHLKQAFVNYIIFTKYQCKIYLLCFYYYFTFYQGDDDDYGTENDNPYVTNDGYGVVFG